MNVLVLGEKKIHRAVPLEISRADIRYKVGLEIDSRRKKQRANIGPDTQHDPKC